MSDAAADFLARAKAAYADGVASYRDRLLEAGRLLHEFILAGLARADGCSEYARLRMGASRESLVSEAAAAFGVKPHRIGVLIATAQVVELLGGGEAGPLGHESLRQFARFVTRESGGGNAAKGRVANSPPISVTERWVLRPAHADAARELFRRAVQENLSGGRLRAECHRVYDTRKRPQNRPQARERIAAMTQLAADAVAVACPGDVAEMLLELLTKSSEPWAVAQRLIPDLQRIKRPRSTA